jgi:hypothetical protein
VLERDGDNLLAAPGLDERLVDACRDLAELERRRDGGLLRPEPDVLRDPVRGLSNRLRLHAHDIAHRSNGASSSMRRFARGLDPLLSLVEG